MCEPTFIVFLTAAFALTACSSTKTPPPTEDFASPRSLDLAQPSFIAPPFAYFDHDTAAATPSSDQCNLMIGLSSAELIDCSGSSLSEELIGPSLRLYFSNNANSTTYAAQSQGACLAGGSGAYVDALYESGDQFWHAVSGSATLTLTLPYLVEGNYDLVFEPDGVSTELMGMFSSELCVQTP